MEVIVRTGSILKKQIEKEIAKPVAFSRLKKMTEQETSKATEKWYRNRIDVVEAAKNARQFRKNLDKISPETLSSAAKDMMWRKAKALKDEFTVGMLSKEELHPVKGFFENGTTKWTIDESKINALHSVERNLAWYKKNDAKIREFKNLMRHLCPQDPNAGDIERFRPKLRGIR